MKYTGMPWDIWTLITPLFREQLREEKQEAHSDAAIAAIGLTYIFYIGGQSL